MACPDPGERELLARVIARSGHEVEQVAGPSAAIEALAQEARVALVALLHDDNVAGMLRSVRTRDDAALAGVPVLVVTDDDATARAATAAGADGTMLRPFHADELNQELDAILARSPEERAARREAAAAEAGR